MRSVYSTYEKGFTLVEMIVSIAIFTIVALVSVGALLKIVDANKQAQSLKTSINNLNFALESMSRELRVGTFLSCQAGTAVPALEANGCSSGVYGSSWTIAFKSSKTINIGGTCHPLYAYQYDQVANTLLKAEQSSCSVSITSSDFIPVISPDIIFTTAGVRLDQVSNNSFTQGYMQFRFIGYSGAKVRTRSYFDLQTSVWQRLAD